MQLNQEMIKSDTPETDAVVPEIVYGLGAHSERYRNLIALSRQLERHRDEALRLVAAKQAEIDRLMLEFCPDEMTPEQMKEWAKHQVGISPEEGIVDARSKYPKP